MKNCVLNYLIALYLLLLFFFSDLAIGVPIISFFPILFIFYFLFNFDRYVYDVFLKFDSINTFFVVFFLYNIVVYIINYQYAEILELNYKSINSSKSNYVYIKTALNGLFSILIFFIAYNTGKYLKISKTSIYLFLKFLLILCLINSVSNIYTWFVSTGGVVGRYNFTPVLVPSQGVSVQYSILGFLILLSSGNNLIEKIQTRIIVLVIFFVSIIIIFSRQPQILFVAILVYYYYLNSDRHNRIKKIMYVILIPLVSFVIYSIYSILGLLDIFQQSLDSDSIDVLVRIASFNEALRIFFDNFFFGTGHGMFALYNELIIPVAGEQGVMTSPHNGLASCFSELGIIGLLCILFLLVTIYNLVFKYNSVKSSLLKMLMSMYFVYTLSLFISNFFLLPPPSEYIYYANAYVFWLLIGYFAYNDRKHFD